MARTAFGRSSRNAWFDAAISACLALFALVALRTRAGGWAATLIGLTMAAAVLLRRTRPSAAGAVVAALAALQTLCGIRPQVFDLAVLVAVYSVVRYADRLRDGVVAGGVVAVAALFPVPQSPPHQIVTGLCYVLTSGAVWLVALNLRTRRLHVLTLEERAASLERERAALARAAVAEERTRIAGELHDVVAHSLADLVARADGAACTIDRDPGAARGAIKVVAETGREALDELRRLVGVLRQAAPPGSPDGLDEAAPVDSDPAAPVDRDPAAPLDRDAAVPVDGGAAVPGTVGGDPPRGRPALGELGALLDRSRIAGLVVRDAVHGEPADLSAGVELTIYRIVQESLTNALKHAGPGARVELVLDYSKLGEVRVRIVDDGGDGAAGSRPPSGGRGLVGMRERAAVYGGCFQAGPRSTGGWEVTVRLPLPASRPAVREAA